MLALVEMVDKQKSIIAKYKHKFKQEKVKEIQKQVSKVDANSYNFTTKTIEFTDGNYKTSKRVYVLDNYFITKYAGTFRIYDMQTKKEVYSMKTTEKLEDAKKYAVYLLQSAA